MPQKTIRSQREGPIRGAIADRGSRAYGAIRSNGRAIVVRTMLAAALSTLPSLGHADQGRVVEISAEDRSVPVKASFVTCGHGERVNCVVDGDTFWYRGEKYRISDINAPEVSQPACAREKRLGDAATEALRRELNRGGNVLVKAERRDVDRYGRKLRVVMRDGRSVGDRLIAEGLAEKWQGRRQGWCGAASGASGS